MSSRGRMVTAGVDVGSAAVKVAVVETDGAGGERLRVRDVARVLDQEELDRLAPLLDVVQVLVRLAGREPLLHDLAVGGDEPGRRAVVGGVDLALGDRG
mgnify:CR=1 FL=1